MKHFIAILLLCYAYCASFAQLTVSGTITDQASSVPLEGVAVVAIGTQQGTFSDKDGKYELILPSTVKRLHFSLIGYKPIEVPVKNRLLIDVQMEADNVTLDEVVIVGYGTEKGDRRRKKRKSHSISTIPNSYSAPFTPTQESYDHIHENGFVSVKDEALSTFSIDVDKASYANVRRFLNDGGLPPPDAVRTEELINYFKYDYPEPTDEHPFTVTTTLSSCPWNENNQLAHIGLKGKSLDLANTPVNNLVFLLDVSGSMSSSDKLPLLKSSLSMLVDNMRVEDKIAIVVYAGAAGIALPSTSARKKDKILSALDRLSAGGSTAGGEGLRLAYQIAEQSFIKQGNNRVIMATDGDFNVGESSDEAMVRLIEEKRESGVFLSVLGFGTGNYKDSKMEKIADKGNGNYAYIDNLLEAKKVLVNEMSGTLYTIAKDVKFQIEFNPYYVQSYRLIGYENRLLDKEDFNDDTKDAGELGAGHTVTALYELIPQTTHNQGATARVDPLKYQEKAQTRVAKSSGEIMTIKLRYKPPKSNKSQLLEHPVFNNPEDWHAASEDFRFSAAVSAFGMLLRDSEFKGTSSYKNIISEAKAAKGKDENGYRAEFIRLVELAELLHKKHN